jgi:DNA polymerase III delta subunit
MKKATWLNKARSFKKAQKLDAAYYRRLSAKERIEAMQVLREAHFKSKGLYTGEDGRRLQRVVRIIESKET